MKMANVTIEVGTNVSEETALRALKVLEWYCQDNSKAVVPCIRCDGKIELQIIDDPDMKLCPCCGRDMEED